MRLPEVAQLPQAGPRSQACDPKPRQHLQVKAALGWAGCVGTSQEQGEGAQGALAGMVATGPHTHTCVCTARRTAPNVSLKKTACSLGRSGCTSTATLKGGACPAPGGKPQAPRGHPPQSPGTARARATVIFLEGAAPPLGGLVTPLSSPRPSAEPVGARGTRSQSPEWTGPHAHMSSFTGQRPLQDRGPWRQGPGRGFISHFSQATREGTAAWRVRMR